MQGASVAVFGWTKRAGLVVAGLVLSAGVCVARGPAADQGGAELKCGSDRRDVKTLSDPDRRAVDAKHPQVRTIDWLVTQTHGPIRRRTPRIEGFETTVFIVQDVTLVEAKKEPDNDVHLVIRDDHPPPTHHMIVEFPNVACGVKRFPRTVAKARAAIEQYLEECGRRKDAWTSLRGTATIRGVGFFDLPHNTKQHGVADNEAELHPVLGFKGSCG